MAEEFAIGKALVIPQSVMNNIEKIDTKINQIASDSEKMASKFSTAMTKMDCDANKLLKRLTDIQSRINTIDISKFAQGVSNVGKGASQVEQFANAISKAAAAINKYNSSQVNKRNVDNTKEINKINKEIEALKKKTEQLEKYRQKQQEVNKTQSQTRTNNKAIDAYNRAMASSEALVTQRINKIAKLRQAEEMLVKTGKDYSANLSRIRQEIERLNKLNQGQVDAYGRVIKSQHNLMNTSDQLMRKLALIFSVSQIEGYISKLVRVRGEFELQNTALASILQNKDQADRLFAQITELAVQSPFTLKELTTYTKSLSAYSVEYEKLYDTTKMLADVSAGLGVDMQRLILAFGQVKAANFLRGTETRQFTEAGINMLGELAKYYSELEGRIVSVAEVQDRQFKRMISFQDVEQVFKRLTSAGGMFYNMQERQAETLAGMMSNLQDRIDLMLNSIGKENEGVIKGVIEILQDLIENYEAVGNAIEAVGLSFLAYKGYLLLTNKTLIQFAATNNIVTSSAIKQLSVLQLLSVGFKKMSISIKSTAAAIKTFAASNLYLLGLTALVTAIYEVIHWNDEYNEKLDEINNKHSETSANLKKIAEAYDNISKKAREAAEAQENFAYSGDTYKELYAQLSKLNEELKNRGYTLPIQLEFVNPENIDEAFKGGRELLEYANDFSTEFKKALVSETTATEGWFGIFGDNLATDLKQLSDSYAEIGGAFKANLDIVENEVINISSKLTGAAREYYNELSNGKKEEESTTEWTLRRLDLLNKIDSAMKVHTGGGYYKSILKNEGILRDLYKDRRNILEQEKEVQYELDKVLNSLIQKYGSLENLKKAVNDNPLVIKTEIDRVFEEMELSEQAKRFASFWASQRLQIPVEFTTPKELPSFFGDFRDTVKTLDTANVFDKQLESLNSIPKLAEEIQKKYKELIEEEEILNKTNTKKLDLTKQITAAQSKLLSSDADEANAARLNIENLENQKKVIDEYIEKEKERVNLEKQSVVNIANALNISYLKSSTEKKQQKTALDNLKDQIALIKKAGEEYKKLRQYYSEADATEMVRKSFEDAFNNLSLSTEMSFDTSGIIEGIKSLQYQAIKGGKEAVDEVVAEFNSQKRIDVKVEGLEETQKKIEDIFSSYEFTLDLKTARIDPNAFKNMLKAVGATDEEISMMGLDTTSFEQAQKKIRSIIEELNKQGGDKNIEAARKYQEQLTQLEVKEARKRFDELLTLREKYQSNEEKIANIEADISSWRKELDDIKQLGNAANKEQEELLKLRIQNGNDAILKLKSEALQLTEFWRMLFGDLEDLSVNSLRRLSDTVDEVISSSKEIKGNKGQIVGYSAEYTDKDGLKKQVTLTVEQYQRLLKQNNQVADEIQKKNPFIALFDAIIKGKNEGETTLDYITRMEGMLGDVSDAALGVANDLANIFGANEEAKGFLNNIKGIADGAINLGTGIARISSGDVLGGLMSATSGISSIVTSINSIHDNKREREIERQTELVENLERAYDKLYNTIENGLSIDTYSQNSALIDNLLKQVNSYQAMIEAEKDKKDTDWDRIKDWQNTIEDIYSQIDELYANLKTSLVGDFRSVAEQLGDAIAEAFSNGTDAAEAWGESVKEIVADMVKNILVQKLIEPGVHKILDQMFEEAMPKTSAAAEYKEQIQSVLDQMNYWNSYDIKGSFKEFAKRHEALVALNQQLADLQSKYDSMNQAAMEEAPNITQDIIDNTLGQLESLGDEVLNNPAWDMLKELLGQKGDTMSGLQRGIEGLSESTGQALEALLNSMRFFTSDSNTVLHNIYNAIVMPTAENPFLVEMKLQSSYLNNLNTLISSVVKNVPGKGKVFKVEL